MNKPKMLSQSCFLVVGVTRRSPWLELKQPRIMSAKNNRTPALKEGEVAIRLNISLPEALFEQPSFKATIEVPAESVTGPLVDAETINNITELVAQSTGLTLTLEVPDEVEPE